MNAYFVARGESISGPFVEQQLLSMWQIGAITADTRIRQDGTDQWIETPRFMEDRKLPISSKKKALLMEQQAEVDVVRKIKTRPNLWLTIVLTLSGLISFFFAWEAGVTLLVLAFLTDQPKWRCGTCGMKASKKSQWCSACGSHLD